MQVRGRIAFLLLALSVPCSAFVDSHADAQESLSQQEFELVKAAEQARILAIEKVYGSVVAVYGKNPAAGGGSGVLYDSAGYALTNYHVVRAAGDNGWAGLADGKMYKWKLVGIDPGGDVAIIKLSGQETFPAAKLGNSDLTRIGDFVMAMGNPFTLAEDQRPTVTLGVVSGVKRYQPGQGANMLVYGNCIQVDSSINPGNSGGPLFNMAGEVIGINGRGSFEERGRVNVGVGYAISIEQIKNFIPDLLATKVVLHGTLDATFGNRVGGVLCEKINLDSEAASQGLALGDHLLSFNGHTITNANQYTNWVSTLPAGWPVHLEFEHQGARRSIWMRLPDLPYGKTPKAKPRPKPGDPKKVQAPVKSPTTKPGEIRSAEMNKEECRRIVAAAVREIGQREAINAVKVMDIRDLILRNGKKGGQQNLLLSTDGRFRLAIEQDGKTRTYGYDGKEYWFATSDGETQASTLEDVLNEPLALRAVTLATLLRADGLKQFTDIRLQGGGLALQRRAYRVLGTVNKDTDLIMWFSVFGSEGQFQTRLLKAALGFDGQELEKAVTFSESRKVSEILLPVGGQVVSGLDERVTLDIVNQQCQAVDKLDEKDFQRPGNEK